MESTTISPAEFAERHGITMEAESLGFFPRTMSNDWAHNAYTITPLDAFVSWASEFGIENMREAVATFKAVREQAAELGAFLGPELTRELLDNVERL